MSVNLIGQRLPSSRLLATICTAIKCDRGMKTHKTDTLRLMRQRAGHLDALPIPKRHSREWLNWNYNIELFAFSKRLGENLPLDQVRRAMIDKSLLDVGLMEREKWGVGDLGGDFEHNEELAAKGHLLLEEFVPKYLRYFLQRAPEEIIKDTKNYLLCDESMAQIGEALGFKIVIMSEHVDPPPAIIASGLKAYLQIINDHSGFSACKNFIIDLIITYLHDKDFMELWQCDEPEAVVNRILANDGLPPYEPRILRETGRNTVLGCFVVGLYSNKNLLGYAPGESVDIAHKMAAYDSLRRFFHLTPAKAVFKYGEPAYKLNYGIKVEENLSIAEWKPSFFKQDSKSSPEMARISA